MKKFQCLSLVLLLCSCSKRGISGSRTTFYNPDISYQQIIDAVEISESEFKAEVDAHYIEPKSRYEHMKCTLTSDAQINYYVDLKVDSLNAYFSLLHTLPNIDEERTYRLFSACTDLEGSVMGSHADIYYWYPVFYMPDIYELIRLKEKFRFFKSPYSLEYGNSESETVRIVYDDNFLPVQVERKTPKDIQIRVWHYDLAYFSSNDVDTAKGEITKEAFAEHYMKLCNNVIPYQRYSVRIKGKYYDLLFDNTTGRPSYMAVDIDSTFNGLVYFYNEKGNINILSCASLGPITDSHAMDQLNTVYNAFRGIENMNSTIPCIPEYDQIIYKYFDSPLRVEGYNFKQNNDGTLEMDKDHKYYMEYNDEGLINKYILHTYSTKGKVYELKYTFTYK